MKFITLVPLISLINANEDNPHFKITSDHHNPDLGKSSKGCLYEDLPRKYDIQTSNPNDSESIRVPVNGHWNCTTKDISVNQDGSDIKDICELQCNLGFGLKTEHLRILDDNGKVILDDKGYPKLIDGWRIISKRTVCRKDRLDKKMKWVAAQDRNYNFMPRCHETCGDLHIQKDSSDKKARLICRNFGAIEEEFCTPGVNCHHMATCYATCDHGFGHTYNTKNSNEMSCKCTPKKCGWDIPEDLGDMGKCTFKMFTNNKRIIGGENATDTELTKSQISAGRTTIKNRKKRDLGEPIEVHRRLKRKAAKAYSWQHICGGVLLTGSWGMTASHCRTVGMKALLGELSFDERSGDEVPCRVKVQIRHPHYDGATYHDIMMLNLQCRRLKMGEVIWPARLPAPGTRTPWGSDCDICGWGTMSYPHYEAASMLQCVNLPIIKSDQCNQKYQGAIHDSIMCIGKWGVGGQDSCQGDSGGGAYCNGITYGLVMGGLYCADQSYPGVYTIVSEYVPWAVNVIREFIRQSVHRNRGRRNKGHSRSRRDTITPHYLRKLN